MRCIKSNPVNKYKYTGHLNLGMGIIKWIQVISATSAPLVWVSGAQDQVFPPHTHAEVVMQVGPIVVFFFFLTE